MWKEHDLVMLSSNQKASPLVLNLDGQLEYDEQLSTYGGVTQQYLYAISPKQIHNEDIGSYVVTLYPKIKGYPFCSEPFIWQGSFVGNDIYRKVMATTNDSLELVPKFSTDFINFYIQEYNIANYLKKVLIDCDDRWVEVGFSLDVAYDVITDEHNQVSVKLIKTSWTLEEMELAFEAGRSYGFTECAEGYGVGFPEETLEEDKPQLFDKWIKKFNK